jgi:hypothetical protein
MKSKTGPQHAEGPKNHSLSLCVSEACDQFVELVDIPLNVSFCNPIVAPAM